MKVCLDICPNIQFKVSPIFCEWNYCTDKLTNLKLEDRETSK